MWWFYLAMIVVTMIVLGIYAIICDRNETGLFDDYGLSLDDGVDLTMVSILVLLCSIIWPVVVVVAVVRLVMVSVLRGARKALDAVEERKAQARAREAAVQDAPVLNDEVPSDSGRVERRWSWK